MAVTHGHGNPDWTREETILALDLLLNCGSSIPSASDPRVVTLSEFLRSLPYHSLAARKPSFRNPDGVSFKIQNLRQVGTGKGLPNTSRVDREVWQELGQRPDEVARLASLIRAEAIESALSPDEVDDDSEFAEGRTVTESHKRRERSPRLRRKFIASRRVKGALECEICGHREPTHQFGEALFEAHHILPLALGQERKTRLKDLALLCANCHRMLHRAISVNKRWLSISEARTLLSIATETQRTGLEAT